jgi:vesicle-fusing ATPase
MVLIFRSVLEEMEMLSAFTAVLHVPNLSEPKHLLNVLEESDAFTKQEVTTIARSIEGRRYSKFKNASISNNHSFITNQTIICYYFIFRIFVGISKLLGFIDLIRQTEGDYRVAKFLSKLEEEDAIELRG